MTEIRRKKIQCKVFCCSFASLISLLFVCQYIHTFICMYVWLFLVVGSFFLFIFSRVCLFIYLPVCWAVSFLVWLLFSLFYENGQISFRKQQQEIDPKNETTFTHTYRDTYTEKWTYFYTSKKNEK